ncbi:MAG TPA: hypothetical protein VJM33_18745 [Microthrixaceae bacterium]|nr:hypothetical protein [Microthrixaceae bacterium]
MDDPSEPPPEITLTLEEALDVLAVLEDAREELRDSPMLGLVMEVEVQLAVLNRKLRFDDGGPT